MFFSEKTTETETGGGKNRYSRKRCRWNYFMGGPNVAEKVVLDKPSKIAG